MAKLANVKSPNCTHKIRRNGFCVLRRHFPIEAVETCQKAFEPIAKDYSKAFPEKPGGGPGSHFTPLPIQPTFYHHSFCDDDCIYAIHSGALAEQLVIDRFATDTPIDFAILTQ